METPNEMVSQVHQHQLGAAVPDGDYAGLVKHVMDTFQKNIDLHGAALFRTNEGGIQSSPLNDMYLNAFTDPEQRQEHNCRRCRHWLNAYGDLVFISNEGKPVSAFFDAEGCDDRAYRPVLAGLQRHVESSVIVSAFVHTESALGVDESGGFNHFHVVLPTPLHIATANAVVGDKNADYDVLKASINDYTRDVVALGAALIGSPAAYTNTDRFAQRAEFFLKVVDGAAAIKHERHRDNYIRREASISPAGWARPRTTVIAVMLDALKEGDTSEVALNKFNKEIDPIRFRRTQEEAVRKGQITAAERIVKDLGLEESFAHRAARLEDLPALVWRPEASKAAEEKVGGLFDALKANLETPASKIQEVRGGKMTYSVFVERVLPKAKSMQVYLPNARVNIRNFITQTNPVGKPIHCWDNDTNRNPVSSYLYQHGSTPTEFGLLHNTFHEVTGISLLPHQHLEDFKAKDSRAAVFIIKDANDKTNPVVALFPANLRSELRPVDNVIEALGRNMKLDACELGTAAGLCVEGQNGLVVKVFDGVINTILEIDRYE